MAKLIEQVKKRREQNEVKVEQKQVIRKVVFWFGVVCLIVVEKHIRMCFSISSVVDIGDQPQVESTRFSLHR